MAIPPSRFWYDSSTSTASASRPSGSAAAPGRAPSGSSAHATAALKPSDVQSLMGQPWSRVLNGHAPLLTWR